MKINALSDLKLVKKEIEAQAAREAALAAQKALDAKRKAAASNLFQAAIGKVQPMAPPQRAALAPAPPPPIPKQQQLDDAAALSFPADYPLAFLTQTTLSVDDTAELVAELQRRFPGIAGPRADDICYATSNRQAAVKAIAPKCQLVLVIGAPNSSNSRRLVEVAERAGVSVGSLYQYFANKEAIAEALTARYVELLDATHDVVLDPALKQVASSLRAKRYASVALPRPFGPPISHA